MMYHAPTGRLALPVEDLKRSSHHLLWALKNIREASGLPLDRYTREHGPLTPADFAQIAVIEAAEVLGIDLGVTRMRFYELDLRATS
jgi:hypothetical protein